MYYLIYIALIVIIVAIIACSIVGGVKHESFTVPETNINAAILFACFKINEHDYAFIEKWHKDIDFYVVVNGDPTEWDSKVIELIGNDRYFNRENKGYDVFAWKTGINIWRDKLNEYDLVGLVNNSCIYAFDLKDLFTKAHGYDMYGVYQHSGYPFVIGSMLFAHDRFLHSYFIIISKQLFSSEDFTKYWDSKKKIYGHDHAVLTHEKPFAKHFEKLGYRIGVYSCNINYDWIHNDDRRPDNGVYHREFIKNKALKSNPKMFDRFKRNMGVKYIKVSADE